MRDGVLVGNCPPPRLSGQLATSSAESRGRPSGWFLERCSQCARTMIVCARPTQLPPFYYGAARTCACCLHGRRPGRHVCAPTRAALPFFCGFAWGCSLAVGTSSSTTSHARCVPQLGTHIS